MNNRVHKSNLSRAPGNNSPRIWSPSSRTPHSPLLFCSKVTRVLSPFERITSPRSIGNSTLPSFLRLKQFGSQSLIKNHQQTKIKTADTSNSDASILNKYKMSPISENISGKLSNANEFINYVFDASLMPDQILLRICKIELSRKDLSCLRPGKLLPINLIDACLSCIKKKNKKLFQKKETNDRVIIVKTSFSQKVFQSKEKLLIRSKKNILNYE